MHTRNTFPFQIECIPHQWITMPDGVRLSARIWRPLEPVGLMPAILEYIPYRKHDGTAVRDSLYHPVFAGHGYVSVRVDIRGSGDSEGILNGEYLPQELDDAVEVIRWLAAQDWCNGKVGMMGKSWGGFNALQVAALQPEALKAVISVCSTDDRYADDVHYKGGCLMTTDMLGWATTMAAWNARPPSPEAAGEEWLERWKQRCEQTPPFIESWLQHQRRDAFWKQGSICEDYAAVKAATLLVGGWADPYVNAIPRMLSGLECPRKALIGPWAHEYPQRAFPGPQIGFTQECLRWWDHWLADKPNDVMDEPVVRAYMPDCAPPTDHYIYRDGAWVGLDSLEPQIQGPLQCRDFVSLGQQLQSAELAATERRAQKTEYTLETDLSVGLAGGVFFPMGYAGDYPLDQRQTDASSLCFDGPVLNSAQAIIGNPVLTVRLKADQPRALLAARLCSVDAHGHSTLVSWGLLNLCHRNSHEQAEDVIPGEWMTLTLQLNACACRLLPGHHWRLALSPAYTAHAWPSPQPVVLCIDGSQIHLQLPVLDMTNLPEPEFSPAECSPPLAVEAARPLQRTRTVSLDAVNNQWVLQDRFDSGLNWLDGHIRHGDYSDDRVEVVTGEPLSTTMICHRIAQTGNQEHCCDTDVKASMTCDLDSFHVQWELMIRHNGKCLLERQGQFSVLRDFV